MDHDRARPPSGRRGGPCGRSPLVRLSPRRQRGYCGLEHLSSDIVSQDSLRATVRMRHESDDIAFPVRDARDVAGGAVGIRRLRDAARGVAIPEGHAMLSLELHEGVRRRRVVAFHVPDRHPDHGARLVETRKRRLAVLDSQEDVAADVTQAAVDANRAGQEPRLEQHLESVADAQDRTAGLGEPRDDVHHRREPRERSRPQVVAIGEPSRQDHRVGALELGILVPHVLGLAAQQVLGNLITVRVAVVARKHDDAELQERTLTSYPSITVLAKSSSAIRRASFSTAEGSEPSTSRKKTFPARTSLTARWPSRASAAAIALPWGSRTSWRG